MPFGSVPKRVAASAGRSLPACGQGLDGSAASAGTTKDSVRNAASVQRERRFMKWVPAKAEEELANSTVDLPGG